MTNTKLSLTQQAILNKTSSTARPHMIHPSEQHLINRSLEAIRSTEDDSSRLERLETKYAKLSVITEALWKLLSEKLQLDEASLTAEIERILKNHEAITHQKIACSACNMANTALKNTCVYCGAPLNPNNNESLFV